MSKKKLFNLVELIAHVLLLTGMAILAYAYVVIDPDFAWAIETRVPEGVYTFFEHARQMPTLFTTIFIILVAINTLLCLASFVGKSPKKDGSVHTVLSILVLLFGIIDYIFPYAETGYEALPIPFCQIVSLVLIVVIVVFSILKRSNIAFPQAGSPVIVKTEVEASQADELKKFKDLLDSGVISQEEFDAKKKQLLGL